MSTTPPAGRSDAFGLVSESFRQAWQRMLWLLFTGPGATAPNWMRWGVIILLAGLTAGGSGANFNLGGGDTSGATGSALPGDFDLPDINTAAIVALIVPAAIFAVLLALAFAYVFSRFRFVFLEGVIAGEPRIGGVFGRTARPGLRYFGFLLLVGVISTTIAVPILLPFLYELRDLHGEQDPAAALATILAVVVPALLVLVPLILAGTLLLWFTRQFALPYMWLRDEGVRAALRSAWRAVASRFAAFLLFFAAYIIASIVAAIAGVIVLCCSCFIWGVPAAIAAVLAFATISVSPWLFIVTGPIILAAALVIAWIFATITAPIPIFFRALTLAFLGQVDPEVGALARGGGPEEPSAVPIAAAEPPPAPPATPESPPAPLATPEPPPLRPPDPGPGWPGPGTHDPGI